MNTTLTLPKKRIEVIDALRGFALMGIMLIHCLEHFDAFGFAGEAGPVMTWLNKAAKDVVEFIFLGKAYAVFSMLFGLSFFIQMQNQADRGIDFRLRFIWRLLLLYVLGHLNGLFYSGEILVVYALFGLILIPLYKLPIRWLWGICIFFLFLVPTLIHLIHLFADPDLAEVTPWIRKASSGRFRARMAILSEGTFAEVMKENFWRGQVTKWLYYLQTANACRIFGLFTAGLLIGRLGIHKDENRMVKYAQRGFWLGLILFTLFFCVNKLLPLLEIEGTWTLRTARQLTQNYYNQGLMFVMVGVYVMAYFRLGAARTLNRLAPVGRMSLTNYMMQSLLGALIFYGFGLGLAPYLGTAVSILLGVLLCVVQITFSRWWIKRYYYGPVEWFWRSATWLSFSATPFKRPSAK